jgi:hypothetical protein
MPIQDCISAIMKNNYEYLVVSSIKVDQHKSEECLIAYFGETRILETWAKLLRFNHWWPRTTTTIKFKEGAILTILQLILVMVAIEKSNLITARFSYLAVATVYKHFENYIADVSGEWNIPKLSQYCKVAKTLVSYDEEWDSIIEL